MRKPILFIIAAMMLLTACRDEDIIAYPISDRTGDTSETEYAGMYVLNEGNMGSNKCTLDYLDLTQNVFLYMLVPFFIFVCHFKNLGIYTHMCGYTRWLRW